MLISQVGRQPVEYMVQSVSAYSVEVSLHVMLLKRLKLVLIPNSPVLITAAPTNQQQGGRICYTRNAEESKLANLKSSLHVYCVKPSCLQATLAVLSSREQKGDQRPLKQNSSLPTELLCPP